MNKKERRKKSRRLSSSWVWGFIFQFLALPLLFFDTCFLFDFAILEGPECFFTWRTSLLKSVFKKKSTFLPFCLSAATPPLWRVTVGIQEIGRPMHANVIKKKNQLYLRRRKGKNQKRVAWKRCDGKTKVKRKVKKKRRKKLPSFWQKLMVNKSFF